MTEQEVLAELRRHDPLLTELRAEIVDAHDIFIAWCAAAQPRSPFAAVVVAAAVAAKVRYLGIFDRELFGAAPRRTPLPAHESRIRAWLGAAFPDPVPEPVHTGDHVHWAYRQDEELT